MSIPRCKDLVRSRLTSFVYAVRDVNPNEKVSPCRTAVPIACKQDDSSSTDAPGSSVKSDAEPEARSHRVAKLGTTRSQRLHRNARH
ncbi:endonuclease/exonuclease/phosphatase [Pseudozyma hubeiensis SY62]|uniref:Endonuclease/exonuclease/phosphatase n=1 Tax=Pseudozyma hubeiensis (strain SY62) TaxID=1305764 RepID=R9P2S2_PSEHS|nr:endonuclease/exonuclease/phosphatase [Pseudozyma hubeiensis SY62]GAC95636.1 endonuclease/exonuclease/phosphatase [Pseudozyma hubeiensis SY62]